MEKSKLTKVIDLKEYTDIAKHQKKSLTCLKEIIKTDTSIFILTSYLAINLNHQEQDTGVKKAKVRPLFPNKKSKILSAGQPNKPNYMNQKLLCTPRPSIIRNSIVDSILDFELRKRIDTGKGARSIRVCSVASNCVLLEIWNYNRYELDFSKSNNDCLTILESNTKKFLIRKKLDFLSETYDGDDRICDFFREFYKLARSGGFIMNDIGQKYFYFKCQATPFTSTLSYTLRPGIDNLRFSRIHKRKVDYTNQDLENFFGRISGFKFGDLESKKFVISHIDNAYYFARGEEDFLLLVLKGEKDGKRDLSSNTKPKPYLYLVIRMAKPKNAYASPDLFLVKLSEVFEEKFEVRLADRVGYAQDSAVDLLLKLVGVEICFPDFKNVADIAYFDDEFELVYAYRGVCPDFKLFVRRDFCELYYVDEENLELNCVTKDL